MSTYKICALHTSLSLCADTTNPASSQAGKTSLTTTHAAEEAPIDNRTDAGGLTNKFSDYISRATTMEENGEQGQNAEPTEDPADEG
mgnify:CR=1 FL=1